jgi:predicted nucleic acid-binding protein
LILDTNALSDWAKADAALLAVMPADHLLVLPVVVIGEYLYGVQRSRERATLKSWLDRTIQAVSVGVITLATADSYAAVRNMLRLKGRPIPANDAWIAALALQHRLPLLSRDAHYDFVDGLTRVTW